LPDWPGRYIECQWTTHTRDVNRRADQFYGHFGSRGLRLDDDACRVHGARACRAFPLRRSSGVRALVGHGGYPPSWMRIRAAGQGFAATVWARTPSHRPGTASRVLDRRDPRSADPHGSWHLPSPRRVRRRKDRWSAWRAASTAPAAAVPGVVLCVAGGIVRIAAGIIRAAVRLSGGIDRLIGVAAGERGRRDHHRDAEPHGRFRGQPVGRSFGRCAGEVGPHALRRLRWRSH
jgi:hypothetical protein